MSPHMEVTAKTECHRRDVQLSTTGKKWTQSNLLLIRVLPRLQDALCVPRREPQRGLALEKIWLPKIDITRFSLNCFIYCCVSANVVVHVPKENDNGIEWKIAITRRLRRSTKGKCKTSHNVNSTRTRPAHAHVWMVYNCIWENSGFW